MLADNVEFYDEIDNVENDRQNCAKETTMNSGKEFDSFFKNMNNYTRTRIYR